MRETHILQIPQPLLDWGKQDEVAIHFAMPWAHEVEEILQRAGDRTCGPKTTDTLLSRLEGLVGEAMRAERTDLLVGFDLFTAEWLGLVWTL
jgi:hypothetical protein